MTVFEERIQHYMNARFPILYLNTFESGKARHSIIEAAKSIPQTIILEWDGTDQALDVREQPAKPVEYPYGGLPALLDNWMDPKYADRPQVLILKNIDTFLDDSAVIARLNKMAGMIHSGELETTTIFIISPVLNIPIELEKYITVVEMDYLTLEEIKHIVHKFAEEQCITINEGFQEKLSNALKGMTEFEIQNLLQLSVAADGALTSKQIQLIFDQKQQIIKKAGILEMVPLKEGLDDIGGLETLKVWLRQKAKVFANMERAKAFGVDMPKGVLIAGIPGCGKSLVAKATAKLLEVPLLRLDMGRLLGKYVGESEANLRKAINLAEAISPCVLWIDELEKAFAGINGEGSGAEVTTRLFGSFLTWLQEKESPVFVVATANDITKLPPELLRKGRFDEIFYVGLPSSGERNKIFKIHIKKRRPQDWPAIEKKMDVILKATEGYSGADVEGVVSEGVELAYFKDAEALTADDLLQVIKNTHSLSEVLKPQIEKMNQEYEARKFKSAK